MGFSQLDDRMSLIEALLLGVFQGITEFLPISSSGHLVLAQHFFGLPAEELIAFDALLHGGTLLATVILFRKEIITILLIPFAQEKHEDVRFVLMLIAATIPAALAGFFFEDLFSAFRSVSAVAISFLFTGSLFLFVEKWPQKKSTQTGWKAALLAGLFQVLALLPGVSRSGITMAGAMLAGTERAEAVRFSFFLGIPITAGVVTLFVARFLKNPVAVTLPDFLPACIAFGASAIIGYLTARFLLIFFRKYSLRTFAIYLICSGFLLLLFDQL